MSARDRREARAGSLVLVHDEVDWSTARLPFQVRRVEGGGKGGDSFGWSARGICRRSVGGCTKSGLIR